MKKLLKLGVFATFLYCTPSLAVPIVDTVYAGGKEWAQLNLFSNNWNEMNAVCPMGLCGNGTLSGYDMAGWHWASANEVRALFDSYLRAVGVPANQLLGAGQFQYRDDGASQWATDFFSDGWRHNFGRPDTALELYGLTSTESGPLDTFAGVISDGRNPGAGFDQDLVTVNDFSLGFGKIISLGGWFFRSEDPTTIPTPGTILLLSLGIIALLRRRKF